MRRMQVTVMAAIKVEAQSENEAVEKVEAILSGAGLRADSYATIEAEESLGD